MNLEKLQFIESYKASLEKMLAEAIRAMNEAQEEANNHVGAMESRYDTFKEEAQYLASAHKVRISELQHCIKAINHIKRNPPLLHQVEVGCIVVITDEDEKSQFQYFILPGGDGSKHKLGEMDTFIVSPGSPIARQLLGKSLQDDITLNINVFNLEGFILSIK